MKILKPSLDFPWSECLILIDKDISRQAGLEQLADDRHSVNSHREP